MGDAQRERVPIIKAAMAATGTPIAIGPGNVALEASTARVTVNVFRAKTGSRSIFTLELQNGGAVNESFS